MLRRRWELTIPDGVARPRLEPDRAHPPEHMVTPQSPRVPQCGQRISQQETQHLEVEVVPVFAAGAPGPMHSIVELHVHVLHHVGHEGDGLGWGQRGHRGPHLHHSSTAFIQTQANRGFCWNCKWLRAGNDLVMACQQPWYWSSKESRAMFRGTTVVAAVATVIASSARDRTSGSRQGRGHQDQWGTLGDTGKLRQHWGTQRKD